jgi:bifunctional DNA-binding transcriptional regulator/antitoxin component of YhaV-PrlF toxin-antitoxin module
MSTKLAPFKVKVYRTSRSFNVPLSARIALGIQGGDSVHLIVRSSSGKVLWAGRKTLKSGTEIYGANDVGRVLEPGSTIFVQASKPWRLEADTEADSFDAQERAAGFQANIEIKRIVEKYAMKLAQEKLRSIGFKHFDDTSAHECYDLTCKLGRSLYFVEVKGTQGAGVAVIMTANEVNHARRYPEYSIAVVVHQIKVIQGAGGLEGTGGNVRVCLPWVIEPKSLKPLQYKWTVSKCPPRTN